MRAALVWLLLILTVGTARADDLENGIRAQLAAQGYEGIEIARKDGQLQVHARRDKLILETVYDETSGKLISERMRQADEGAAAKQ
ncbi:hypothetical protein [Paracoccus xiamenensis]|uniref:hypothetical protein n=1 Tax=Paracoccus xiamenensis TaxID=2714901 RepID=UPI00140CBEC9|nr:hypothetical protein [Paracoccus xiamenensis]NHF74377.1 hypothetical protein [Paracoccus xiamenensis]